MSQEVPEQHRVSLDTFEDVSVWLQGGDLSKSVSEIMRPSHFFKRAWVLRVANIGLAWTALSAWVATAAEPPMQFNKDIRPILSDKCFFCHGPDENKRKKGLRLDTREGAFKDKKTIVPGKPDESDLIRRVTTSDADDHMPPAGSKIGSLTSLEVQTLRRWIAQGAPYEQHWAFIPLRPTSNPKVKTLRNQVARRKVPLAPSSPIDSLVWSRLAKQGLAPQPEADPATLIRRVSFDLTGLPPKPADVEAFIKDRSPKAYERLVDRLLKTPQFGERMAVDWLDISRYADSYGFQVDRDRDVWVWRDWVVRAFNQNLPFDKFITWQLAGDLLPNPTDDQILATAFNRLHQQESEGGSVEEEYRVEYVADRVQTFATAFLGLTFECARCHDHKYDPITQKEYYQFFSCFQNIDEAGLYSYFTMSPPTPAMMLLGESEKDRRKSLQQAVVEVENQTETLRHSKKDAFEGWLSKRPEGIQIADEIGRFDFDILTKGTFANGMATNVATLTGENKLVPGRRGNAVVFTGDDPVNLAFGNFNNHDPFSVSLWIKTPDVKDRAVVFHRSRAWTDAASRGYELLLEDGKLKWSLIHFWPGNAISIRARSKVATNEWTHVAVTSDGSSRAAGLRLFVNGRPAEIEVLKDSLTKEITGGGGDFIALGERFRDRGFKNGLVDDFRVFSRSLTTLETLGVYDELAALAMLRKPEQTLEAAEREILVDYFLATSDADWRTQLTALKKARSQLNKDAESIKEIMVMRELPSPKPAYVLARGEYNQRRDRVSAGVPASLPPLPKNAPANRLGLAMWLTDPSHPLFARVTVNRFWLALFGSGLVKTTEDFGSQGARPQHPDVLNWLAYEFMRNGWDTKALFKTMVMSHTYRQRSVADEKTMTDDPENEWLARGPRFRLPAEMIRDNALFAAGLLNERIGGPPVNPYEMSEAFRPTKASGGDGVYRRSLYTAWRRTSPPPAMLTFDAPRRAVCASKRERTDSPLQALILLNGVQYVEAARVLGETLHTETQGDIDAMINQGFMRCLSRKPDSKEVSILRQLYAEQLAHFKLVPAQAKALLQVGGTPHAASIPAPEAAAAAMIGQALLNHDASVVKR